MGDTTNSQDDPAIAEILAQRQKEMDESSPKEGKKVAPTQSAVESSGDPDIDAIIAQRQKDLPTLSANLNAAPPPAPPSQPDDLENIKSNVLSKIKNLNKTDAELVAAGAATGYTLPKMIEKISEGRTDTPENELRYRQNEELAKRLAEKDEVRNKTVGDLMQEHYNRQNELISHSDEIKQRVANSAQQLENARLTHAQNMLTQYEDLLPPEFRTTPSAPESVLTRQPLGGTATETYGEKFGLTPLESLNAPSMSQVQKQIPNIASAIAKAQDVGPEFGKFKESPLLVGPEAQQALAGEVAKQKAFEDAKAQATEHAKRTLARQQAQSKLDLENLNERHTANLQQLNSINRQLEKHYATPPVPPIERLNEADRQLDLSKAQAEMEKYYPSDKYLRPLAFIGRKVLPRFNPILAGALAPEQALKAKELYDKGEYAKAAAYGLGTVGSVGMATGVPFLSGLGALANIPAAGLEAYELGSGPTKP
jgi:hypothetical protein